MSRTFTASISFSLPAGPANARTLMILTNPATKILELTSAFVSAANVDASEQIELAIQEVNVLGAPTGTVVTPAPHAMGGAAALVTAIGNVTASEPSYVADTQVGLAGASSVTGYRWEPVDEDEQIELEPSGSLGLRLLADKDTACILTVRLTFREKP